MPWGSGFIEALKQPGTVRPRWVLESVGVPVGSKAFGGSVSVSSFSTPGYAAIMARSGHSVSYGRLRLRSWTVSPSAWSIALSDVDSNPGIRSQFARGQVLQLRVGFTDDPATFERVAVGVVQSFNRGGSGWVVQLRGLEGSLSSRFTSDPGESQLQHDLASTDLSGAYTPGDSVLNLTSAAGFRLADGVGACLVTPTSGDLFVLTYTGTTATTLTGVSGAAVLGTTAAAALVGDTVSEVAYYSEHPLNVARSVLVSTGTGTNSAADLLPESWGLGIPEGLVDASDIKSFIPNATPSIGGGDKWEWGRAVADPSPAAALFPWLQSGGFFVTQIQGDLTARAIVNPFNQQTPGHLELTQEKIQRITQWETWDASNPVEYWRLTISDQSGGSSVLSTDGVEALPAAENERTLSGVYSSNADPPAWRGETLNRLGLFDIRTAEILGFDVAGWYPGISGPGDTVDLTLDGQYLRDGRPIDRLRGVILHANPNWFGSSSRVICAFLPVDAAT